METGSKDTMDESAIKLTVNATKRLKDLVSRIVNDEIETEEVLLNLRHICHIIHKLLKQQQQRRSTHEDEDLSDLLSSFDESTDTIAPLSNEIRSWLESTFTKHPAWQNVRTQHLTLKEAAIKIKARIRLHRLFGGGNCTPSVQPTSPTDNIFEKTVDNWNFDVFTLNKLTKCHVLHYIGFKLFQRHSLVNQFEVPLRVLEAFLMQLESGYSKYQNPYHNLMHAADVIQTCHFIISRSGLWEYMSPVEIFALLYSALIHDYEHTGTTNAFQINLRTHLALLYNDRGVQENHHLSAAFRITQLPGLNIFVNVPKKEYQEIRHLSIEMVLNTDMSTHFFQIKTMNKLIKMEEPIERHHVFSMLLHCADISHPTKEWRLHESWTNMLTEEFFTQGDRELALGLPCSPLCDRRTTLVPQSQIGFINFIVAPSFHTLEEMLCKVVMDDMKRRAVDTGCDLQSSEVKPTFDWKGHLTDNKMRWQQMADENSSEKPS